MSDISIRINNVSKKFFVKTECSDQKNNSLYSQITGMFSPIRYQEFWALKDISFDIHEGESIGLIGLNGAGKSTLLKIISDIIKPSSGKIEICGKLAAILEIGVGFHPELSGRNNIYLYGKMLGFTQSQIESKFEEIVSFSEVGKFIDTPIKRYSSGMLMRLGFGLIAVLETDIIILDEMLAVGDTHFRSKCLKKIMDLKNKKKTIIIAGHNLNEISNICDKLFLIDKGQLVDSGHASHVLHNYQKILLHSAFETRIDITSDISRKKKFSIYNEGIQDLTTHIDFENKIPEINLSSFHLISANIQSAYENETISEGFPIEQKIKLCVKAKYIKGNADMAFVISDMMNNRIFGDMVLLGHGPAPVEKGIYDLIWEIPAHTLSEGIFKVGIVLFDEKNNPVFSIQDILTFSTKDNNKHPNDPGFFLPMKPKIEFNFHQLS